MKHRDIEVFECSLGSFHDYDTEKTTPKASDLTLALAYFSWSWVGKLASVSTQLHISEEAHFCPLCFLILPDQ